MRSRRGFNLAEVILALGILAFAFIVLVTLMAGGLRQLSQSAQYSQAQSLARQQLERIRAECYGLSDCSFDGRIGQTAVNGFPPPPYPGVTTDQPYKLVVGVHKLNDRLRNYWVEVYWEPHHHLRAETLVHE